MTSLDRFRDRIQAGEKLGDELLKMFPDKSMNKKNIIVMALARGGVRVGAHVAKALGAPLDVLIVRKIGMPGHEELALGALATGGTQFINEDFMHSQGFSMEDLEDTIRKENQELKRREKLYRGGRSHYDVEGKTLILVDDGLATGATMKAAIFSMKKNRPKKIVVAVPVGEEGTCAEIRKMVDDLVCLLRPFPLYGVGLWYLNFPQVLDMEVKDILSEFLSSLEPFNVVFTPHCRSLSAGRSRSPFPAPAPPAPGKGLQA